MTEAAIANADIDWADRRARIDRARLAANREPAMPSADALAAMNRDLARFFARAIQRTALREAWTPVQAALAFYEIGLAGSFAWETACAAALAAQRDARVAAWLDDTLKGAMWREVGVGVARGELKRDGTWDCWPFGEAAEGEAPPGGARILTIPVCVGGGFDVDDVIGVELEKGATGWAEGRAFSLTSTAAGLGLDTGAMQEWRGWSRGLAIVASPIDWIACHARDAESGVTAPMIDGVPAVWLGDLDTRQRFYFEKPGGPKSAAPNDREAAIDRLLIDADPILVDGAALGKLVAARLSLARKRALPKRGEITVWTPDEPALRNDDNKGEAA